MGLSPLGGIQIGSLASTWGAPLAVIGVRRTGGFCRA